MISGVFGLALPGIVGGTVLAGSVLTAGDAAFAVALRKVFPSETWLLLALAMAVGIVLSCITLLLASRGEEKSQTFPSGGSNVR